MKPKQKSLLLALFSLAIFLAAAWVLKDMVATVKWQDVSRYFTTLPTWRVVAALGFAAASYYCLSWYDTLAVRFVSGRQFAWRKIAATSFTAYAFGHNLGVSTLSGGAVRLRDYSRMGLSPAQVGGVVTLLVFALGMGSNVLLQYSLFFHTDAAARILRIQPLTAQLLGVGGMVFLLGYLWVSARRHGKPLGFLQKLDIPTPSLTFSLRQLSVSIVDLSCSAAAFYCLLPVDVGYASFLGFYVLAMISGIVSNVPGGLGVFESVLLLTIPSAAPAQLAGAALAFRAVYYLLPFVIAVVIMAVRELSRMRQARVALPLQAQQPTRS